ncbi:ABC transporter substrate-binding protein [Chloroflexota bacterium]
MEKRRRWIGLLIFLSVLLMLQVGAVGCSPSPPAGTEIRIGVIGGQTGPAAAQVVALIEEVEHTFNYINEVEDGIDGVKLNWRIVDNKGTPEGAILAYKELRAFEPHTYFVIEDYYLLGAKEMIEEDEAVLFTASAIDPRSFLPPGRFFGLPIPTSDGFAGYVQWVLDNHEGPEAPKIGVLYWGDLPTGLQWRTAESWVRKQGVELEPVEYSIAAMDLTTQMLRLRDAEVDYIWMLGTSPNAAVAIRDFLGLGLGGKIPFTFNEYVEANVLLDMIGETAEGFYVYRSETPYSDGSQAAELYTEIWQWAADEDKWSDNRLVITLKAAISASVRQAVADVGWEALDSAAIYDALNTLSEINTDGNTVGYGFSPSKRVGVSSMKMAQFTKDGTVAISEPILLPRTFEGIDK